MAGISLAIHSLCIVTPSSTSCLCRRYTWNIEKQELCPGVDGKCEKEEL